MTIAGLGPALVALSFLFLEGGDELVGDHLKACFDPRGGSRPSLFIGLLALLTLSLLPALIAPERPDPLFSPGIANFLWIGLVFGALEEVGWRAYGQRALEDHHSPLVASLIIGIVWGFWHLPLFFLKGTYQAGIGLWSTAGIVFFSALVLASPLYAWLQRLPRSTPFVVLLYHGGGNAAREVLRDAPPLAALLVEAMMTFLVLHFFGRNLLCEPASKKQQGHVG